MNNNLQNEKKKRGLAPAFLKYVKSKEYKNTSVNDIIKQINDRLNEYEKQSKMNNLQNEKAVSKNNSNDSPVLKGIKNGNDFDVVSDKNLQSNRSSKVGSLSKNQSLDSKSNNLESLNLNLNSSNNLGKNASDKLKVESGNAGNSKTKREETSEKLKNNTLETVATSKGQNTNLLGTEEDVNNLASSVQNVVVGKTNLKSSAVTKNADDYSGSGIKKQVEEDVDNSKTETGEVVSLSSSDGDRLIVSQSDNNKSLDDDKEQNSENVDSKIDSTTGDANTQDKQGMDALIDKLNEINNKERISDASLVDVKPTLGLEKKEEITIDEDELRESISNALSKENATKKASKQKLTSEEIEKILNQMQSLTQNAEVSAENISNIYDEEREDYSMDALKRGLARSSIALLKIAEIDNEKANKLSQIAENLSQDLTEKEQTIQNLQNSLSESFEKLDLELAEDIENELSKKIEELKKQQEEILEFNNNVNKLEAEYQLKLPDKLKEAEEYNKKIEQEQQKKNLFAKGDELYRACVEYFNGMDRQSAINEFLQTKELQTILGSAYGDVYNFILKNCR